MINLSPTPVVFDEPTHTYTLHGKRLSGVTPVVAWMFPETYGDVPQAVLDRAAARGSLIHSQCRMAANLGLIPDDAEPEVRAYIDLLGEAGLTTVASEYLVSDGQRIASSIDVVLSGLALADIKTTSTLHIPQVTLQLSIYAWLFELQNPTLHAGRLYAVWLPKPQYGTPRLVELDRLPADKVRAAVEAYLAGEAPAPHRTALFPGITNAGTSALPADLREAELAVADIERELAAVKARRDTLADGLLKLMERQGVKRWQGERVTLTYVAPATRKTLDTARLKTDYPDLCDEYAKETQTKASVRIILKKN